MRSLARTILSLALVFGSVVLGVEASHASSFPSGGSAASGTKYAGVVTVSGTPLTVTTAQNGILFKGTATALTLPQGTAYPEGFWFAILETSGDSSVVLTGTGHGQIYDELGARTDTYGSTAGALGFYIEFVCVGSAPRNWVVTTKQGVWGPT